MTDTNGLEARIAELLDEIRTVKASPRTINPDGTPGPVAPGELIESSWGNAVAAAIARHPHWIHGEKYYVVTASDGTARVDLPFSADTAVVTIERETWSWWLTTQAKVLMVIAELSTDGTDLDMNFLATPSAGGAIAPIGADAGIWINVIATGGP